MQDAVIGLEIHVQLGTRTKAFCGCVVEHGSPPNTHVCPVCLGLPGALPVANAKAVELAIRAATLLGCTVHRTSRFVRKNYFYPDLPKGYQITQLKEPLATAGSLTLSSGERVRIRRAHIEEDAGKLLHDRIAGRTAIDFNRCGIPLLEIVTEPDIRTAASAAAFGRELKQLLQYAGVSECEMELGSLRVDANVSIAAGADPAQGGGARTELKNLNSFAQLERAIDEEIRRQRAQVGNGGTVAAETLAWDADGARLRVLRPKETQSEYRYLVEPDLPALVVTDTMLARAQAAMPELPAQRAVRFATAFGIPAASARALTSTRPIADYFETVASAGAGGDDVGFAARAASWVLSDALAWCNTNRRDIAAYPVPPAALAALLAHVGSGTITRAAAREVLRDLEQGSSTDVTAAIARRGADVHPPADAVMQWVREVLAEEDALVARYRAGEQHVFGYLMGRLMQKAGTGADPREAVRLLRARLLPDHPSG